MFLLPFAQGFENFVSGAPGRSTIAQSRSYFLKLYAQISVSLFAQQSNNLSRQTCSIQIVLHQLSNNLLAGYQIDEAIVLRRNQPSQRVPVDR
jgi:hypothetical protein